MEWRELTGPSPTNEPVNEVEEAIVDVQETAPLVEMFQTPAWDKFLAWVVKQQVDAATANMRPSVDYGKTQYLRGLAAAYTAVADFPKRLTADYERALENAQKGEVSEDD